MKREDFLELKQLAERTGTHVGGAWRKSTRSDAIVCDVNVRNSVALSDEYDEPAYYGGYLVAESIPALVVVFLARFHPAQVLELLSMVDESRLT